MTFANELSMGSFIFTVINGVLMGFIAFIGLQFVAKAKIKVGFELQDCDGRTHLYAGEKARAIFHLQNVGRFYAHPAAINCAMYVNFDPNFNPELARYGSTLELNTSKIFRGKANSKYFKVSGICLFYQEPSEDIEVLFTAPEIPGLYKTWIAAQCESSDLGVHEIAIQVEPKTEENRTYS